MMRALIEAGKLEETKLQDQLEDSQFKMGLVLKEQKGQKDRNSEILKIIEGQSEIAKLKLDLQRNLSKHLEEYRSETSKLLQRIGAIQPFLADEEKAYEMPEERKAAHFRRKLRNQTEIDIIKKFVEVRMQLDDTMMRMQEARSAMRDLNISSTRRSLSDSRIVNELMTEKQRVLSLLEKNRNETAALKLEHGVKMQDMSKKIRKVVAALQKHGNTEDSTAKGPQDNTSCEDDPFGQVKAAGVTCKEVVQRYGCDFDLAEITSAPNGYLLRKICPETCDACSTRATTPINL